MTELEELIDSLIKMAESFGADKAESSFNWHGYKFTASVKKLNDKKK